MNSSNRPHYGQRTLAVAAMVASSLLVAPVVLLSCSTLAMATTTKANLVSTGLKNLGNTCYLSAQLQSAFHIPKVRQVIGTSPRMRRNVEDSSSDDPAQDNDDDKSSRAEETAGLLALRQIFRDMEAAATSSSGFPPVVAPTVLCHTLGIPVMEQQDSQEFWKLLLPALKLESLTDLYQGAYEDYITAVDGSGRERRRDEPFLDLSLDVTRCSILESLQDMFGTPELLSEKEGNGWRPEKGADKIDALKGSLLRVNGLPSILQCHLKRFQYDWQTDVMSKINDRFTFPKELDLSSICTDIRKDEEYAAMYDLQAVVVHIGEYGAGHYYAYVRPDIQSDNWYRFNDHEVTSVSFRDVVMDAYGGKCSVQKEKVKAKSQGRGLLTRLFGSMQGGSYGWGGRTSSAYMLQYVRRKDIPLLYGDNEKDLEL